MLPEWGELSSGLTFFYKYVFSTIWIAGFGAGTVALLMARPAPDGLMFVVALIFGSLFILLRVAPLKKVTATEHGLLVSNYRVEVLIPYAQIEDVLGWNRIITVRLRSPGPFGKRFAFMPYGAFVFGDHPAATFLRDRMVR